MMTHAWRAVPECAKIMALMLAIALPSHATAAEFSGIFTQGGFVYGRTLPGAAISLDGRNVPVSADGRFFLAFHRDAGATAKLVETLPDGAEISQTLEIAARQFKIERIDGLPQGKVQAPPERQKRISAEAAKKRAARAKKGMQLDWAQGFIAPVDSYRITGVYGSQRVLNGAPRRPHYGLDFAAPTGTPVKAPAGGIITLAEPDFWYEGGLIFLDHGHGLQSAFLHMSAVNVKPGDVVQPGDVIGAIGSSGRSTGPHLDWRVNWGTRWIDPALLMTVTPIDVKAR